VSRRNHRRHAAKRQRYDDPTHVPRAFRAPAPVVWDKLVLPVGRYCGKLAFTEHDAPAALRQAQDKRKAEGSAHMEKRWYLCPRCNWCHLTSRETWSPEAGHE
jgi:hypothetical protein